MLGAQGVTAQSVAPAAPAGGADTAGKTVYTMEEVEKHTEAKDCWFVVRGKVYNGTPFMADHPGGGASILITGGTDCTEEFEAVHSPKAWKLLDEYEIGILAGPGVVATGAASAPPHPAAALPPPVPAAPKAPVTLDRKRWVKLPLTGREEISHNTRVFRFSLQVIACCITLIACSIT